MNIFRLFFKNDDIKEEFKCYFENLYPHHRDVSLFYDDREVKAFIHHVCKNNSFLQKEDNKRNEARKVRKIGEFLSAVVSYNAIFPCIISKIDKYKYEGEQKEEIAELYGTLNDVLLIYTSSLAEKFNAWSDFLLQLNRPKGITNSSQLKSVMGFFLTIHRAMLHPQFLGHKIRQLFTYPFKMLEMAFVRKSELQGIRSKGTNLQTTLTRALLFSALEPESVATLVALPHIMGNCYIRMDGKVELTYIAGDRVLSFLHTVEAKEIKKNVKGNLRVLQVLQGVLQSLTYVYFDGIYSLYKQSVAARKGITEEQNTTHALIFYSLQSCENFRIELPILWKVNSQVEYKDDKKLAEVIGKNVRGVLEIISAVREADYQYFKQKYFSKEDIESSEQNLLEDIFSLVAGKKHSESDKSDSDESESDSESAESTDGFLYSHGIIFPFYAEKIIRKFDIRRLSPQCPLSPTQRRGFVALLITSIYLEKKGIKRRRLPPLNRYALEFAENIAKYSSKYKTLSDIYRIYKQLQTILR